jgi:ribonuclease J
LVDRAGHGVGLTVLKDRKTLANEGMVSVAVTVDEEGFVLDGPDLLSHGVVPPDEFEDLLDDAREVIVNALTRSRGEGLLTTDAMRKRISEDLGRFLQERTHRRPALHVMVQVLRTHGMAVSQS